MIGDRLMLAMRGREFGSEVQSKLVEIEKG